MAQQFRQRHQAQHQAVEASVEGQFGTASLDGSGELSEDKRAEIEEESDEFPEVVSSSLKVLASIGQGAQLCEDARRLKLPLNPEFKGEIIIAQEGGKALDMGAGLRFKVAGPMLPEIDALRKKRLEWLEKLKEEGKKPADVLAAYADKSVPNLSTLVLLAKVEGKTMLLTGDARGDKILKGLQLANLLGVGDKTKMEVDILKLPHHGSSNNLDKDFFQASSPGITCSRATANTAIQGASRWKCCSMRAPTRSTRST